MPLQSFRVTKKEIDTYYNPKTTNYDLMVNSINSNGYGQIIEQYIGTEVLYTYYNIWDNKLGTMVVYDKVNDTIVVDAEAGPTFFGVNSVQGLDFLNGTLDISGLRKLKYCNGCEDGNGLDKPVIDNFKKRFTQLSELVYNYGLFEGFLFYDESLPKYQDVFPAAKIDDGVNVTYQFKSVDGTDLSIDDVSLITSKPVSEIEVSVDTSEIIKPQEGSNTVVVSCCDKTYHIIPGQTAIGAILHIDSTPESYCWYAESLTDDPPTIYPNQQKGPRSCEECIKIYGCPTACEELYFAYSTDPSNVCSTGVYNYYNVNWDTSEIFYQGSCGDNPASQGYYYDGKMVYYFDGTTFSEYGPCPSSNTKYVIEWCCNGEQQIASNPGKTLPVGSYVYFDVEGYSSPCWYVKGETTARETIFGTFNGSSYGDCKGCQYDTRRFC